MQEEEGASRQPAREEPLDHILAHDISNYINIIQGNAELLLTAVDDPELVDRLHTIKRQATAADAMLQTVGGVTRGGTQTAEESVRVDDLLSSEIDRLEAAYPDAQITADIKEQLDARADDLLQSVFANLLENAIQHNDTSNPTVRVTATHQDGNAVVTVTDDGPGLPDEVRNQLLGRNLAHPQSGAHIIRALVERYGGDIAVETSQTGTEVAVILPTPLARLPRGELC